MRKTRTPVDPLCSKRCFNFYKDRYHLGNRNYIRVDYHSFYLNDLGARYCKRCKFYTFREDRLCRCCRGRLRVTNSRYRKEHNNLMTNTGRGNQIVLLYQEYRMLSKIYK